MYGKDLIKELKSELSGHFEETVLCLLMPPAEHDAYQMHIAMKVCHFNSNNTFSVESKTISILLKKLAYNTKLIKDNHKIK